MSDGNTLGTLANVMNDDLTEELPLSHLPAL